MKKILIVFLIVIVIALSSYLGIKSAFLNAYKKTMLDNNTYWEKIKESLDTNTPININANACLDCYEWANLKFNNDFANVSTESLRENGHETTLIFKDNLSIERNIPLPFSTLTKEFQDIISKEKLITEIEIYKYIANNYNKDLNFFSSIKELKEASVINSNAKTVENSLLDIKELTGEYEGYLGTMNNNIKYVVLTVDEVSYSFTFYNNYTENQIIEFISSVVIE